MIFVIKEELKIRRKELTNPIESIYFGGGSPSLLKPYQLNDFIKFVIKQFEVDSKVEITLEVNPDDVDKNYLLEIKSAGVNRISLGVQSFFEKDLLLMNRAHNVSQVHNSIGWIKKNFKNYSLDLIYGMPYSYLKDWKENLSEVLKYDPPHISAYALTVEKKTVLDHLVRNGKLDLIDERVVKDQYDYLVDKMEETGYINYEFSNFGKPSFFSLNNTNYWEGKPYLGLGPSAHSFDGSSIRKWNISNNHKYLLGVLSGKLNLETEFLSKKDRYNEYIMTGLRKLEGLSLDYIKIVFGKRYADYLEKQTCKHLNQQNLFWDGNQLKIAKKAKFLTDGVAVDLFMV